MLIEIWRATHLDHGPFYHFAYKVGKKHFSLIPYFAHGFQNELIDLVSFKNCFSSQLNNLLLF